MKGITIILLIILLLLPQILSLPKIPNIITKKNTTTTNEENKLIIGKPPTTTIENKKINVDIKHFILNTTGGLYAMLGIIILIIISLILLSQWKKNLSSDNPLLMENQGI